MLQKSTIFLSGTAPVRKNGRSPFTVEAAVPGLLTGEAAVQFGCPNTNATARIDFVYWTDAAIRVVEAKSGAVLVSQEYACSMALSDVSCKPEG